MSHHHVVLVVEFDVPADDTADAAFDAMLAKIRAEAPRPATNVTAHLGVPAEVIGQAAAAGQVVAQSERLHLEPGDHVVVTIKPDQADTEEDLQRWSDVAREAFPGHEVVVAWEGTTVTAQTLGAGESA